ncbi:hypothetical protein EQH51_03840 [Klebsiella pneumoniae]|uniref:hypothetical protein n=1 Tax=Klebsiella pneumoniae TaxID=573 RepID=UPI00128DD01D|nr:hypothetical protein [Klebsiella pneumoniae]QFU68951.1 hypothetical protein EQH51_03840 [Klebsiella pneumoniae]
MTKSTITRERVVALIAEHSYDSALVDALEHLLAAMDSEPVAWTDEQELRDVDRGGCGYLFTVNPVTPHADERRIILLYRHAQLAPASPVCTCPSGDGSLRWPCPVHPGNSPVIPDGYVMVPKEPTKEMINAGWLYYMGTKNPSSKGTYKAMLAAIQQEGK